MKKSNLYAERVYSDHPIALWTFDDNVEFFQILNQTQQDALSSNWSVTGATKSSGSIGAYYPIADSSYSKINLTSASASISSSFSINYNTFSDQFSTACFSAYIKPSSFVYKAQIGVSINSVEEFTEYFIDENWNSISHTFDIDQSVSSVSLFIKLFSTSGSGQYVEVNALSLGQWSEGFIETSIGFNEESLSSEVANVISNPSQYTQFQIDSYGIDPASNGYYLVKNKSAFVKPTGIPLVYGSDYSLSISPNDTNPSLVIPGMGFMNDSGKYNNYTLEMWLRVYNKSIDPIRILGPVESTDGIYLEEGFISIYVGPYTKSYFLGKYDRPMLLHLLYSENSIQLMINGSIVISFDIDSSLISFPVKESGGYSLDWLGVYGDNLVFPFEIDCISIYPYLMPSDLAKKHFVYGQGVEDTNSSKPFLSRETIQIDFPFSKYSNNVIYPDMYNWRSGFSINADTTSSVLKTSSYSLPEIIIRNGDQNVDESDWFLENRNQNTSNPDIFPYILMSPNATNTDAYIYFDNLMIISSKTESLFGVFRSPITASANQSLMTFFNKGTGESIIIRLDSNTLKYIYKDYNSVETMLDSEAISNNEFFGAGININDFSTQHYFTIRNFFSNHGNISLAIGGGQNDLFAGKIYAIHIVDNFFHTKDLESKFVSGILDQTYVQSDLLKYIGNYSLIPVYKNVTMGFDIGSVGYWEDLLPLSLFGKYVSSSAGQVYDLDTIQFNIDTPYRQGIDESQNPNFFYYSLISYLGLESKTYADLQSMGYSSYQQIEDDYINNISSLRYSTGFRSFITIQDYEQSGGKSFSDFINTASADGSKVVVIDSGNILNTKYEIFDNHVIIIPKDFDFNDKYLGIHLEMQVRATLEKNMGIKNIELSSLAFNDGSLTEIGTKYYYPIYPVSEPV